MSEDQSCSGCRPKSEWTNRNMNTAMVFGGKLNTIIVQPRFDKGLLISCMHYTEHATMDHDIRSWLLNETGLLFFGMPHIQEPACKTRSID